MYRMKDFCGRIIYATEDERKLIEFCNSTPFCDGCPYNVECDRFDRKYETLPYTFVEC